MNDVIGLDLSVASTGICIAHDVTMTVKPHTKADHQAQRLNELSNRIAAYFNPKIKLAAIEGYSMGGMRGLAVLRLAELGGVVRVMLFERGIPYVEVPPSMLKRFATGSGKASKEQMIDACPFDVHNDDEADAWWLHEIAFRLGLPGLENFGLDLDDSIDQIRLEILTRLLPTVHY